MESGGDVIRRTYEELTSWSHPDQTGGGLFGGSQAYNLAWVWCRGSHEEACVTLVESLDFSLSADSTERQNH